MSSPCGCSGLRRASRALTRLYDEALAPAGLTTTQFAILRMLARLGPSSVTALARATGHERSAMTRSLRPLADIGYVTIGDGPDQRTRAASISDAGRKAILRAEPGWREMQARVEAGLGPTEHAHLHALLGRIEKLADFEDI